MSTEKKDPDIRRYLFEAYYKFLADLGARIYLVAHISHPDISVPVDFANQFGVIILDITMTATEALSFEDGGVMFSARFRKVPHTLYVPWGAMLSIYDKNSTADRNRIFDLEVSFEDKVNDPLPTVASNSVPAVVEEVKTGVDQPKPPDKKKPTLTLVK